MHACPKELLAPKGKQPFHRKHECASLKPIARNKAKKHPNPAASRFTSNSPRPSSKALPNGPRGNPNNTHAPICTMPVWPSTPKARWQS